MALSTCSMDTDLHQRELTQHGTIAFPLACYDDDLSATSVPWHWHDELEAFVVINGSVLVRAEGQEFALSDGEGFFINAGALHAVRATTPGCHLHSLVFHPRFVGAGIDSVFWLRYIGPLLDNPGLRALRLAPPATAEIESAWGSCVQEPPGYEFAVRTALSRLVLLLGEGATPAQKPPSARALRDDARIKQMLQFIHTHYSRPLTVAEIAASAALSESECLRCFRHAIGVPPICCLNQYRIEQAAELLRTGEMRAADIGALCGLPDASYFGKLFRREKGLSPAEYRRLEQHRTNEAQR